MGLFKHIFCGTAAADVFVGAVVGSGVVGSFSPTGGIAFGEAGKNLAKDIWKEGNKKD